MSRHTTEKPNLSAHFSDVHCRVGWALSALETVQRLQQIASK